MNYHKCGFCILALLSLLLVVIFSTFVNKRFNAEFKINTMEDMNEVLITTAEAIQKALIHAKSLKTRTALNRAKKGVTALLNAYNISYDKVTSKPVHSPKNVCPEEYKGTQYGFHLWNTGFVETKCSYKKKTQDLITIISYANNIVDIQLPKTYENIKIIISTSKEYRHNNLGIMSGSVQFVNHDKSTSPSEVWKHLLQMVTTEYVLFARDVTCLDEHVRLERLIRAIETLGVSAAAGAFRNNSGHWKIGCRQRAMRAYTLVYQDGYDESSKECMFCDDVEGPFVIQTKKARSIGLDTSITGKGFFEDFFLRLGDEQSVVCPDVMYHVNRRERKAKWKDWNKFAVKWQIYKIKLGNNDEIVSPCNQDIACKKIRSLILTPCCIKLLAKMTAITSSLCRGNSILCEVDCGTLMGAVKFSNVLPWELDADLLFPSTQYNLFNNLIQQFKYFKYSLTMDQSPSPNKALNNTIDGGSLSLRFNTWRIELYGRWCLNSQKFQKEGKNQTMVNINGHWVGSMSNPGLYLRNRYGVGIFKHTVHWSELGYKHSYIPYTSYGSFIPCVTPGKHNCVDRFEGDGNLQFQDPIP